MEIKKERTVMKRIRKLTTAFLVIALLVTSIVAVPAFAEEDDARVHRIAGASRYLTAVEASKEAYTKADTVIIAAGANFPDALAASALAGKEDAPVLLAEHDGFREGTLEEIARLGAKKAIVLGGEKALAKEVDALLKEAGLTVERIAGENRYETAALVAKKVLGTGRSVFLTNGDTPWDALAIGPVSAMTGVPILLTKADALRAETKAFLVDNGITHVTILGGPKAVSEAVKAAIPSDIVVNRVAGDNREATAIAIATKYFEAPEAVVVATRDKFADALVGGYFGGLLEAPLLLVGTDAIRENTEDYLLKLLKEEAETDSLEEIYVLGGEAVVSKGVEDELEELGVVKSVAAIKGQVVPAAADNKVALKFLLNGKREITAAQFAKLYDYEITFKYNASTDGLGDDGVVTIANPGTFKYKYAVQASKDGDDIPETLLSSDYVDFQIREEKIANVTKWGLAVADSDAEEFGEPVDYLIVGDNEDVRIAAFEAVDSFGKVLKDDDGLALVKPVVNGTVTSSNAAVADYVGARVVAYKAGTAVLTFKFEGINKTYTLKVTVKEARKSTSIANKNTRVPLGTTLTWANDIVVLDQYGDKMATPAITVKVKGVVVETSYKFATAGKYAITVFVADKQIGSFTVEAVNILETDARSYGLEFASPKLTEFKYSFYPPAAFAPLTLAVNVEVYAKNTLLPDEAENVTGDDFIVKSSDVKMMTATLSEGVITVTPVSDPAVKFGSATITLYKVEGTMETPLKSIVIEVKNVTPQINKVEFKKGVEELGLTSSAGAYTVTDTDHLVITDPKTPALAFSNDLLKSIDYNETDGIAVITLKDEFGGKSFTFPVAD